MFPHVGEELQPCIPITILTATSAFVERPFAQVVHMAAEGNADTQDAKNEHERKASRGLVGLSPPARPAMAGAQLVSFTADGAFELVRLLMNVHYCHVAAGCNA